MNAKEQKILKLSKAIFALEEKYGHLKWKVTDLEKKSGISRTLIYRYLGSNKSEIFKNSLNCFIDDFYGLGLFYEKEGFVKKVYEARTLMIKHSEAIIFYQKWRMSQTKISKQFINIELKFQEKLTKLFPKVLKKDIPIVHAIVHGLVTAPFLSPEQAVDGLRLLQSLSLFGENSINFDEI